MGALEVSSHVIQYFYRSDVADIQRRCFICVCMGEICEVVGSEEGGGGALAVCSYGVNNDSEVETDDPTN